MASIFGVMRRNLTGSSLAICLRSSLIHANDTLKGSPQRYNSADELKEDLLIIDRSLRHHYADYVADTHIRKFIRQVELFGFHLAALDVRQHSKEHENAMTEILANMNIAQDYGIAGVKKRRLIFCIVC